MSKQTVFLVGATGETGRVILDALVEDGSFDITCFIRTSSADKPEVQALRDRGLTIVTGDITNITTTVPLLRNINTIISAIFPLNLQDQLPLIDAAIQAGVRRFVPCNFGTPSARGGIMRLRDLKEDVHDYIFRHRLGFTIIDVGFWYEMSFPRVPSGKFDEYAYWPYPYLFAGGTAPNLMTAKTDVGKVTAKIIKDDRTLNKRVYAYGDVLSQNEISKIIESRTGERPDQVPMSAQEVTADLDAARKQLSENPNDISLQYKVVQTEYSVSKYVRVDNSPENAEYLGYISARDLYPDFKYKSFSDFIDEVVAEEVERVYPHLK